MSRPSVVILEVAARPLYWAILAVSVWVLLRGHNEPGGGFIGALVAVSASVLWAVAHSAQDAERRMPTGSCIGLAALGVLCSVASGIPPLLDGGNYLHHWWGELNLGFTDVTVSTVLLFDVGVYLAVWGALGGYAVKLIALDASEEVENA